MEAISQQYFVPAGIEEVPTIPSKGNVDECAFTHSPDGLFEDVNLDTIVLSKKPVTHPPAVPPAHSTDTTNNTATIIINSTTNDCKNHRPQPNGLFGNNHNLHGGLFADVSSATGSLLDQMLLHTTTNNNTTATTVPLVTIQQEPQPQDNNKNRIPSSSLFSLSTFDFLDLNSSSRGDAAMATSFLDVKVQIPKGKLDLFESDDALDDHR